MSSNLSNTPFKKIILRLTGQSFIYGLGQMLEKVTRFAIIPFYLKYLSPADFGIIAISRISPVVITGVLTLCLESTITRFYYEWKKRGDSKVAIGSIWLACSLWGLAITFLMSQFGGPIFSLFFKQVPFNPYIRVELLAAGITCLYAVPLKLIRMQEKAKLYSILSYVSVILCLTFNIYFIAYQRDGAFGAIKADLMTNLFTAIPYIIFVARQSSLKISMHYIKQGLRFSLPLVPGNYIKSLFGIADSFLLEKFVPIHEVGLYALAKNLANIVREVSSAIKTAWVPFYVRVASEHPDYKKVLGKSSTFYFYFIAFVSFVLAFFSKEVILFLGRGAYIEAARYVPLLVLANFIINHDMILECGLLMAKKTGLMSVIPAIQLSVTLAGGLILIPVQGAFGAIYSILAGNIIAICMLFLTSNYYYPIFFERKKLLENFVIAIFIFILFNLFIADKFHADNLLSFSVLKIVIVLMYFSSMAFLIGIRPGHVKRYIFKPKIYFSN